MAVHVVKNKAAAAKAPAATQHVEVESSAPVKPLVKLKKAAPAPEPEVHQVVASTTVHNPDGTIGEENEIVGETHVVGTPAIVKVSMGLTRKLADYESIRFDVSLSVPCEPTADDLELTYAQAKEWVDEKVNAINEEVDSQIGE